MNGGGTCGLPRGRWEQLMSERAGALLTQAVPDGVILSLFKPRN